MTQVNLILDKIKAMLMEYGFEKVNVINPYRTTENFVHGNLYCIPQYIEHLGFLIEYASSCEEAKNHGHEDGEVFPLAMGEIVILEGLKKEIEQNMDLLS